MTIPSVDAAQIVLAMNRFDTELRNGDEWRDWESNRAQTYVISHEGRKYPPKKIISLATGTPVSAFSGGSEANSYLESRGITVERLRRLDLRDALQLILERYKSAKETEEFAGFHSIRDIFDECRRVLEHSDVLAKFPNIHVAYSYGKGNWATIPWIALLDERETRTTQDGTYVVILFRDDGAGCYIKLAQGVTVPMRTLGAKAEDELRDRAIRIRNQYADQLKEQGFDLSGTSDLGTDKRLAKLYEVSTIASRYYPKDAIPQDEEIFADIQHLLDCYDSYVSSRDPTRLPAADLRDAVLLGTWRGALQEANAVRQWIHQKGSWASWWSFPIRGDAKNLLKLPFYLYLNTGKGAFSARMRVIEYKTSTGDQGIETPWPEITKGDWVNQTRVGEKKSGIFKTWLKVDQVDLLDPPLQLDEFDPIPGLSVPESLLNQSSFGYAYDPGGHVSPVSPAFPASDNSYDFAWLLNQTLLAPELLKEMIHAVKNGMPQLILAGPPGTSKTWVAQKLATHLTGGRQDAIRLVQFHPSYSYESFVEGLRPMAKQGGGIDFALTPGVVTEFVETIRKNGHIDDDNYPYVLVIDEVNRANLPRVFGELMYLLEYRSHQIRLQYSPAFSLPKNLYILATMNTADRSIRSIDVALRRRFEVFELGPDVNVLNSYYEDGSLRVPNLVDGFTRLNEELTAQIDRHHAIGHTFFMQRPFSTDALQRVWNRRVYPLIEEYFFDQPDLAAHFTLERYWPEA